MNETKYKRYRNILTSIIRDCKRKYFEKEFEEHKHNGKKTWKLIGEALNKQPRDDKLPTCFVDDNETYTSDRIASGFNDFFTSIGQKLVSSELFTCKNHKITSNRQQNTNYYT